VTVSPPTGCPRCGAAVSGNFCATCGTALAAPTACLACGTALLEGANFCRRCGAAVGMTTPAAAATGSDAVLAPGSNRVPWLVASVLCAVSIASVVWAANKRPANDLSVMSNAGNAASSGSADGSGATGGGLPVVRAPDISNMSPRERFVKLEARVTQALQTGDTTTVINFTPMAINAYQMLPDSDRDIDIRYHAAMLQAQIGLFDGARALADTILVQAPGNLFGYYVKAIVGEFSGDSAAARGARAEFRQHYDAEMAKHRPEYTEHQPFLEQYRKGDGAK
jgi:hypothetical protein